jgi:MFS family permease
MEEKRKILIREIEHWRKSKLLPEHYCDFLLNIYLENSAEKPESSGGFLGVTPSAIKNSNWKIWILIFGIIGLISFSALNFTAFELPMQMGVAAAFLFACYTVGSLQNKKEPVRAQVLFGMASLFLLFIGVFLMKLHNVHAPVLVVGYVVFCSLVWILTGLLARRLLYQLCGWVVLVFCYGWLLHYKLDSINWLTLELSWVPLSILFGWLGWMIHEKSKQIGTVFLMLSCIVWFMPELYGMLYAEQYGEDAVQMAFLGKLLVEASLLFVLRKKWTEWVA